MMITALTYPCRVDAVMRGVIASEEALMPGHCPARLLHRESEIREIGRAIKPLFEGRQPDNLFIFGGARERARQRA